MRLRRRLATLALAVAALVAPMTNAAPAQANSCASVFDSAFVSGLQARHPGIKVTAAVFDARTGCWYHVNKGMVLTTASVIKAQVLGAVLLKAQREGRALTTWEQGQISRMIRLSYNPETANLYAHVGGAAAMEASDRAFGVPGTTHTPMFGVTTSTAVDRTLVSLRLLHNGTALTPARRAIAWQYMSTVHPLQRWGISAGLPAGWTPALKNGFYPASGRGWRVGSTGFVRHDATGNGYAMTVLTEGATDQVTGIRLVEEVSRRAAARLTGGTAVTRPVDRAHCLIARAGESWRAVTMRRNLPPSLAPVVRSLAGDNHQPLSGQRVCSPVIR